MAELRKYSPVVAKPVMVSTAFQHAGKHFDFVLGIDFHWTVTPLNWIPLPLPHPFVGIIFDIMDYIHFSIPIPSFLQSEGGPTSIPMGGSVMIFNRHKATTTTSVMGIAIPFNHLSGMFPIYFIVDKPMAPHEGEVYYGSPTVLAQGCEMGGNQPQHVLTCWSPPMGLTPLPTMPGKIKKNPLAYFAFYSRFLKMYVQINTGGPVLIGGAFQPHKYTLAEYLMRFAGMALMRGISKAMSRSLSRSLKGLNNAVLKRAFGPSNKLSRALCKRGFEPVNFVTGEMSFEWDDFELQGSTLLTCSHSWQSQSPFPNMFGKGVFSSFDLSLLPAEDKSFLVWKHPEELIPVHIPYVELGEEPLYYRPQKIWIERVSDNEWTILHQQTKYTYLQSRDVALGEIYHVTSVVHADGTEWEFEYQKGTYNLLKTITDQAGRQLLFEMHGDKKHVGKIFFNYKDEFELLARYDYDERGNLTHVFDRQDKAIRFVYDKHDRVVERINRNEMAYWWKYDELGRVIETSGANGFQHGQIVYHKEEGYNEIIYPQTTGKVEKIYYDENGLIEFEVDALGGETWYDYTASQEQKMVASPEGLTVGYEYDEWGNLTTLHKTDGESIRYSYNGVGQPLQRINVNGNTENWLYDDEQRLIQYTATGGIVVDYEYDGDKRLPTKAIDHNNIETNWYYNSFGQLLQMSTSEGLSQQWEYDVYGRLLTQKDNSGLSKHWKRDDMGRVRAIYENGQLPLKISYDAYDLPVKATDGREEWMMEYTPMGSLHKQIRQSLTKKEERAELFFAYDEYENLLAIRNEKDEFYRFVRNEKDEVIEEIGFDGQHKKFMRNADGQVTRVVRHDGTEVFYDYDTGGRLVYTHYADGFWEAFEYDKAGLLAEAANPMARVKFSRNNLGQIIQEEQEHGHIVSYHYNAQGQLKNLKSSLGADVSYSYDHFGYLSHVAATQPQGQGWQMQLQRFATDRKYQRSFTGGVESTIEYDHTGLPLSQVVRKEGQLSRNTHYSWKEGARLASVLNMITGDRVRYDYDSFGSLASANYNNKETVYKNPDAAGNLYKTKDRSDRKYGNGGKLLKDEHWYYHYDAQGNLILKTALADRTETIWEKGDWAYQWLSTGMLAQVTRPDGKKVQFEYDALGRRTAKVFDGIIHRYMWDGNVLLHEWSYALEQRPKLIVSEDGVMQYDHDELLNNVITWVYETNSFTPCGKYVGGNYYSIVSDYLGTPVLAFNEQGLKVWERELDCYGRVRKGDNKFVPFLYPGQYADEETGLAYNRFRYYDVESGNYVSQDPIGLEGGLSFYNYVKDINLLSDVLGLMPNNTGIGDAAELDFVNGLKKRGWDVYLEIKNGSQNGIDVLAQHPLTKKVHAFEVKANSSRLSVLQKGDDYVQNILDEVRTKNTLRGKSVSDDVIDSADRAVRDIKKFGLEGRLVRYEVDASNTAKMKSIKIWKQNYK
jgi:RHS repeat-associated protein